MRVLSSHFKIASQKTWFFETLIFAFFFLNAADLLHIPIGIFKLRASYAINFLFLPLILFSGFSLTKRFLWGFSIFSILCALSCMNSSLFWRSFSYYLQEIYILSGCFIVASWVMRTFVIKKVLSLYLSAYLLIALYGLWQFIAPYVGVTDPFVLQKIVRVYNSFYNRPNSICLEPAYFSYYISFILCGFGAYGVLVINTWSFWQRIVFFILGLASLFSMTTTALVQFLWVSFFCTLLLIIMKKKHFFKFAFPLLMALSIYGVTLASMPALLWPIIGKFINVDGSLTSGPDAPRITHATSAWDYFKKHPFIGYSYGGLGPLAYAQTINENTESLEGLEGYDYVEKDPQPIPLQLLASFGIIGVIGFVYAAFLFVKKGFEAYKLASDEYYKHLVLASLASLTSIAIGGVWMMGPLIPAVWVHLGLCYGLYWKISTHRKDLFEIAN